MLNYEQIKKWSDEHKTQIVTAVCLLLMFFLGFGVGSYDKQSQKIINRKKQSNYNIKPFVEPKPQAQKQGEVAGKSTSSAASLGGLCAVKGNISAKGKKIYHIKGGAFYEKTKAEQCFDSEAGARAAGFVKSSR